MRIERVLLGVISSFDLRLRCDGSLVSRTGVGGDEDSVEAGVSSNFRRGMGRRMVGSSFMVKAVIAQDLRANGGISDPQRRSRQAFLYWHPAQLVANQSRKH